MRLRSLATSLLFAALLPVSAGGAPDEPRRSGYVDAYELRGGRWWDGTGFSGRTLHVVDGLFSERPPQCVETVVDLDGLYVVPPYAEAHTHTIAYVEPRVREFLDQGVFYALVMNVHRSQMARSFTRFNRTDSVDLTFATASVTASDGHPVQIGLRGEATLADLDGDWITVIEGPEDLETKWPALAEANPDLIKLFLVDSERYAEHHGDDSVPSRYKGMDPSLVPDLVERAHAAGLRVAAHVRTGHDFGVAVRAGVDIVAHLPGFVMGAFSASQLEDPARVDEIRHPERFRIASGDARLAAEGGVTVVPTIGDLGEVDADLPEEIRERLRHSIEVRNRTVAANLSLLHESGVRIAIGSDEGEGSPVTETLVLHQLGLFSNAELINMLTVNAPRLTFPRRAIAKLAPGYEASFLALGGDPTASIEHLRDIRLPFKQGAPLGQWAEHPRIHRRACPSPDGPKR